jgi:DNA-binding response OmpR family regulator
MNGHVVPRILVADHDRSLADTVAVYLGEDGFLVSRAYDAAQAMRMARETMPDLIVLDPAIGRPNGTDVFRTIRAESDVACIIVSARKSETDVIVALELGADDYLTKPFSSRELVARIGAVLRRSRCASCFATRTGQVRFEGGDLEIDRLAHQARRNGHRVPLTPTEFRILEALARNRGNILTRSQLLDCVSSEGDVFDRTLDKHIANLRKKIEDDPSRPRYVVTVFGVGYKFLAS